MISNCANRSIKCKEPPNIIKTRTPRTPWRNPRSAVSRSHCSNPNPELIALVAANKSTKLHCKTPKPASCNSSIPVLKAKCISLVELPVEDPSRPKSLTYRKPFHKECGDESKLSRPTECIEYNIPAFRSVEESTLAKVVLLRFTTNAWRKQTTQAKALQILNRRLKNQVENLGLQTFVLKDLLASESERVQSKSNESALLSAKLKNELQNYDKLKTDLIISVYENSQLQITISRVETEYKLLQDKLSEVHKLYEDARNWIDVYHKEEEDFKEKQSQILKKLSATEDALQASRSNINCLKNRCSEYQTKIEKLSAQNQEILMQNECKQNQINQSANALQRLELELTVVKTVCSDQNSSIERLTKNYEDAQAEIREKNRIIEHVLEVVQSYETDREALKHKFKMLVLDALGLTLKFIPSSNYLPF